MTIQHLPLTAHPPSFFLTIPLDQPTTTRKVVGIAIFIFLTIATAGIYACIVFLRATSIHSPPPSGLAPRTPIGRRPPLRNTAVTLVHTTVSPDSAITAENFPNVVEARMMRDFPPANNPDIWRNRLSLVDLRRFWQNIPLNEKQNYGTFFHRVRETRGSYNRALQPDYTRFFDICLRGIVESPAPNEPGFDGSFRAIADILCFSGLTNCGDNLSVAVDDLWVQCQLCVKRPENPPDLLRLVVGEERIKRVDAAVAEMVRDEDIPRGESLESQLHARLQLKIPLQLPLLTTAMHHEGCSGLTNDQIATIGTQVLQATSSREQKLTILCSSKFWQDRVREMSPLPFDQFDQDFDRDPNNDLSPIEVPIPGTTARRYETDAEYRRRMERIQAERAAALIPITRSVTEDLHIFPPGIPL